MTSTRESAGTTRIIAGGLAVASLANTMPAKLQNVFASAGLKENELLHLSYPLVHEGVNLNGDEFLPEEMQRSYASLIGTPLDKDHDQGIDSIIGQHYAADLESHDGELVIVCSAYVYAGLYPDIAIKLKDGSINGVSMECRFAWAERTPEKRTLHGVGFMGAGLVRTPADVKARPSIKASFTVYSREQQAAVYAAVASMLANAGRL